MNFFFLAAGILMLFLAAAHTVWGKKNVLAELSESNLKDITKTGFLIAYHQMAAVLAVSGIATIVFSVVNTDTNLVYASAAVFAIIDGTFTVFIYFGFKNNTEVIKKSIPQIFLFTVLLVLMIFGILEENGSPVIS